MCDRDCPEHPVEERRKKKEEKTHNDKRKEVDINPHYFINHIPILDALLNSCEVEGSLHLGANVSTKKSTQL